MGCISSKGISKEDLALARIEEERGSAREGGVAAADESGSIRKDGSRTRLIPERPRLEESAVTPVPLALLEEGEKEVALAVERSRKDAAVSGRLRRAATSTSDAHVGGKSGEMRKLGVVDVPNGFEAAHAAAGWPSWLTSVAGDAVKGWLPRKAESFEKLDKIGQGTYSSVYRARDLETGKLVALKKVRFVNMEPESVRFMSREIYILRRLNHPNVVKLEGLITSQRSCSLYLVFEYMEHDLAGLAATPGIKFSEPQIKCYMQQLLSGLDHCHSRGVLHRDIKGSNLLIDNNGILKIADFGLATFFNPDQKQQLTTRVVTLWYRPPELLLGATEYDVAVDLWSTGCILAELLIGKPIMPGRTEVEQLHKIFKLCGSPSEDFWRTSKLRHATIFKPQHPYPRCLHELFTDFPLSTLNLLDRLLAIEPANRGTATSALESEFFTTKPLACDPSSLPQYPASKEFDAKLRDEEARRQRAAVIKGHGTESGRRGSKESKVLQMPGAFAESQKQQVQTNSTNGSGYSADSSKRTADHTFSHSGRPSTESSRKVKSGELQSHDRLCTALGQQNGPELRTERISISRNGGGNLSHLGPARNTAGMLDNYREKSMNPHWPEHQPIHTYNPPDVAGASEKQEWFHNLLDRPGSSHRRDGRTGSKDPTIGYTAKKNRIHYSGPLVPLGGNMEQMLQEHEAQIQQAVRKARLARTKARNYNGKSHPSEALLYDSRNGQSDA